MAARKPNWDRIKAEYLAGGTSYRQLAEKYGVVLKTLERRAKSEGWADECRQVVREVSAEIHRRAVASRIMSAQEVLEGLSNIARGGMRRVGEWGPGGLVLRASEELSEDDAALVFEVSETRRPDGSGSLRVKMADPLAAYKLLGDHYGLFSGSGGGAGDDDEDSGPPERFVVVDPGA